MQHRWRQRELGPAQTVWAFLLQILHGNVACTQVTRLAQLCCSATAYCTARTRLPLALVEWPVERTCQQARGPTRSALWHGHRTFFVDGSSCSMPDTPELQQHFGQQGQQQPGCGFPTAPLVALFDASTGLLIKALAAPLRTYDMSQVARLHPELAPGDILVGDRGFCSYAHWARLVAGDLHAVLRLHQRVLVSFRQDRRLTGKQARRVTARSATSRLIKKLGKFDQLVEYVRPRQRPAWMTVEAFAALPATIVVRELRYATQVRGYRTQAVTLVTTLVEADLYPAGDLAELYRRRWEIETHFAELKTTMKMDVLRCQTVEGVLKELSMYALVYNLVRLVMMRAAREQGTEMGRISFIDALRWLAAARCEPQPLA